jgi:hypothetical protein
MANTRIELPHMSADEKQNMLARRLEAEAVVIEEHRSANAAAGHRGKLMLTKLLMMRDPSPVPGFLRVYPNYKHQNKADGFGCMRLSPKWLGPVEHGQPGLPPALNIENFHQGTKVFEQELDAEGNPSELYIANRLRFYTDPVPHRHKYQGTTGLNKNIPIYFLWLDHRDSSEHRLTYVESRQFYCNFYERLASVQPDFKRLVELMDEGTNLQICGFDAKPLGENESLDKAYLDPSVPFGHERVLYAMLCLRDTPECYPWRKYKTFDF